MANEPLGTLSTPFLRAFGWASLLGWGMMALWDLGSAVGSWSLLWDRPWWRIETLVGSFALVWVHWRIFSGMVLLAAMGLGLVRGEAWAIALGRVMAKAGLVLVGLGVCLMLFLISSWGHYDPDTPWVMTVVVGGLVGYFLVTLALLRTPTGRADN